MPVFEFFFKFLLYLLPLDEGQPCCAQRWIVAYMGLCFGIIQYVFTANMSVAVVCMVKAPDVEQSIMYNTTDNTSYSQELITNGYKYVEGTLSSTNSVFLGIEEDFPKQSGVRRLGLSGNISAVTSDIPNDSPLPNGRHTPVKLETCSSVEGHTGSPVSR